MIFIVDPFDRFYSTPLQDQRPPDTTFDTIFTHLVPINRSEIGARVERDAVVTDRYPDTVAGLIECKTHRAVFRGPTVHDDIAGEFFHDNL